jgi:hypothetical protein
MRLLIRVVSAAMAATSAIPADTPASINGPRDLYLS